MHKNCFQLIFSYVLILFVFSVFQVDAQKRPISKIDNLTMSKAGSHLPINDLFNYRSIAKNVDSISFNQKLIGSDFDKGRLFGRQVAISGDTVAINAWQAIPRTNKSQGLVYVFVRREGVWIQQAKLVTGVQRRKDEITGGLAIDGDVIVAGVLDEDIGNDVNQGAAYVFTREGNNWAKKVRLKASGGQAIDLFGCSVGISGDTIIIGARGADPFPEDGIRAAHGAAYIFKLINGNWVEKQRIQGDSTRTGSFGMKLLLITRPL